MASLALTLAALRPGLEKKHSFERCCDDLAAVLAGPACDLSNKEEADALMAVIARARTLCATRYSSPAFHRAALRLLSAAERATALHQPQLCSAAVSAIQACVVTPNSLATLYLHHLLAQQWFNGQTLRRRLPAVAVF